MVESLQELRLTNRLSNSKHCLRFGRKLLLVPFEEAIAIAETIKRISPPQIAHAQSC
jgi:hypothetical protein